MSQVDAWLLTEIDQTRSPKALAAHLRAHRDRALLLLGFWRAFRTDELLRLWVEHIEAVAGHGMVLYLPRTKTVSALKGREYKVPALSRLCPVQAYLDWIAAAEIERGPVFRRISANGALGSGPLHPSSLAPLLRARFRAAGVADADGYSGHSLRRGFATWASERGWDTRELMDYVGWSDVSSATRYVERADVSRRARLEEGLAMTKPSVAAPPLFETSLEVSVLLERDNARVRSVPRARRYIERSCLAPHAMQRLDDAGARYRIRVLAASRDELDETLADLLEQMHTIAANNQCVLDAQIRDEAAGKVWD
nr:site-specific integrase [Thiocystis violacea]